MAEPPPPNQGDNNTIKAHKMKGYPRKAKGISFSAFLLSIFIYISIFYVFDLSPSTLFNTTKFWFLITNTLILIIAADYGAFSSSKQNQDLQDQPRANFSSPFVTRYTQIVDKSTPQVQEVANSEKSKVVVHESEIPENTMEKNDPKKASDDNIQEMSPETAFKFSKQGNKEKNDARRYYRSETEKTVQVVKSDISLSTLFRSSNSEEANLEESIEKQEPSMEEKDDKFATMSNEELNRRVEEFIQNFNRQIRLQRAGNFY